MVLAAEPEVGQAAADSAASADKDKKAPPPVQEGDILLFQVKLSTEGFPQAVQVRKLRRLRGVVRQPPSSVADGIIIVSGDETDAVCNQNSDEIEQLLGAEVKLSLTECGQLQLCPNDEIAFCCVSMSGKAQHLLEAQLVEPLRMPRAPGSFLGCFVLSLPKLRQPAENDVQVP